MTESEDSKSINSSKVQGFDLASTISIVWREKNIVILTTALFTLLTIFYLNVANYHYTATLKLTQAQSSSDGLLSNLGNVAGIAALAGGSLSGGAGAALFLNYGENLQSRTAAQDLAGDQDLLRAMFPKEWDAETGKWREPTSSWSNFVNGVKGMLGLPIYPWRQPDAARVQDYLERHINVVKDQRNPIITVTYSDPNPQFALQLLERLHEVVDRDLRNRAFLRSEANVAFLLSQLQIVTLAEHRVALAEALSEQEKTRMLAQSSAPFAAEPISAVSTSLRPTSPRPVLFLAGGLVVGLVLGAFAAIIIDLWRSQRRRSPSS